MIARYLSGPCHMVFHNRKCMLYGRGYHVIDRSLPLTSC